MVNSPIRILVLSNMSKYSGGEICIFRIVGRNSDFEVSFALPHGDFFNFLSNQHVSTICIDTLFALKHQGTTIAKIWLFFTNFLKIRKIVRDRDIELVIANGAGLGLLSGLLNVLRICPGVVVHHHPVLSRYDRLRYVLYHLIVLTNSCTVAVSEAVKNSFSDLHIFQKRIKRIYNGIPLEIFEEVPMPSSPIERTDGVINVGLVATISKWKGHLKALEALNLLIINGVRSVRFYFIGEALDAHDRNYKEQLLSYISKHELGEFVKFTGRVSETNAIYSGLDVVLNCSILPEPFGTTIYEAMGFGKIVIASNVGGTPEMISNQSNGYIYQPNDVHELYTILAFVAQKFDSLGQIRQNARFFVKNNLDVKIAKEKYRQLLQGIARNRFD